MYHVQYVMYVMCYHILYVCTLYEDNTVYNIHDIHDTYMCTYVPCTTCHVHNNQLTTTTIPFSLLGTCTWYNDTY